MAESRLQHDRGLHKPTPVRDQLECLRVGVRDVADGMGAIEDMLKIQVQGLAEGLDLTDLEVVLVGLVTLLRLSRKELENIHSAFSLQCGEGLA